MQDALCKTNFESTETGHTMQISFYFLFFFSICFSNILLFQLINTSFT